MIDDILITRRLVWELWLIAYSVDLAVATASDQPPQLRGRVVASVQGLPKGPGRLRCSRRRIQAAPVFGSLYPDRRSRQVAVSASPAALPASARPSWASARHERGVQVMEEERLEPPAAYRPTHRASGLRLFAV